MVSELLARDEKGRESVEFLVKQGKVTPEMLDALGDAALSDAFGWTPKEIDEQDPLRLESYRCIIAGKSKAGAASSRKMKKELK